MSADPEFDFIQTLWGEVLRTSNKFLYNCTYCSITVLRLEQPTYTELAEMMREVGGFISALGPKYDPLLGHKAKEYCDLMVSMAIAIEADDHIRLRSLVEELQRKPGI
jgi:hypothetical protein